MFRDSWFEALKDTERMRMIEAIAWARKYLMAASVSFRSSLISIRGIILIRLISKPIHEENQELEEMAINVPEIKRLRNKIW